MSEQTIVSQTRSNLVGAQIHGVDFADIARRIAKILKRAAADIGPMCADDVVLRSTEEVLLVRRFREHTVEEKRREVAAFMGLNVTAVAPLSSGAPPVYDVKKV